MKKTNKKKKDTCFNRFFTRMAFLSINFYSQEVLRTDTEFYVVLPNNVKPPYKTVYLLHARWIKRYKKEIFEALCHTADGRRVVGIAKTCFRDGIEIKPEGQDCNSN